MRSRKRVMPLLIVGLLVQGLGCRATKWMERDPLQGSDTQPAEQVKVNPRAELPPAKAAEVCLRTALELEKSGYHDEAAKEYEKAREFNPRLSQIARRLAVLYDKQGNDERAKSEYQRALAASPNDPELLNDVGYFAYERGLWSEAEEWLRKAIALDPNHQRAWVNLGMALGQQGRNQESLNAFSRVVTPAEAEKNLGIILAQRGDIQQAKMALQRSLMIEPDAKLPRAILAELDQPNEGGQTLEQLDSRMSAN
jgi:Tfp pilus assembly protein PilF